MLTHVQQAVTHRVKSWACGLGCLALSDASCVTLGKFLNHSVSDSPSINGDIAELFP